jgi:hypothetical protein
MFFLMTFHTCMQYAWIILIPPYPLLSPHPIATWLMELFSLDPCDFQPQDLHRKTSSGFSLAGPRACLHSARGNVFLLEEALIPSLFCVLLSLICQQISEHFKKPQVQLNILCHFYTAKPCPALKAWFLSVPLSPTVCASLMHEGCCLTINGERQHSRHWAVTENQCAVWTVEENLK